ncbi:MAG: hypothetical protein JXB15_12255 [Anaerolineales bacterium]|nr:hypothetical protein [Anaerolineales bacterium]
MKRIYLAVVLMVLLLAGLLATAANAAAPGEALYALDRAMETARLQMTVQDDSQAALQQDYARERLAELDQVAQGGDRDLIAQALDNVGQSLSAVEQSAIAAGYLPDETLVALLDTALDQDAGKEKKPKDEKNKDDDEGEIEDEDEAKDQDDDEPKEPKQGTFCDGTADKNHPTGDKLAERYGVDYAEIIGWYCQGYGFGEVDLAYRIAEEKGISASEIFALRAGGMSWGEIMKQYELTGKPPKENDKAKGKGQDNDNNKDKDKEKTNNKP